MNANEKEGQRFSRGFREKERIDTQIHRRRKVKAFSPLESEWESSQAGPSSLWGDEQSERDSARDA
jgi:hypothetical protein